MEEEGTLIVIHELNNMAAANLIAPFGFKLDALKDVLNIVQAAQHKTLETRLDAQVASVRESAIILQEELYTTLTAQNNILAAQG